MIVFGYDDRFDDDREQYIAAQEELVRSGSKAQLVTLDELITIGGGLHRGNRCLPAVRAWTGWRS